MLAHHFLDLANKKMGKSLTGFTNAAMDWLVGYAWAGTSAARERDRATVALSGDTTISADMLSEHIRGAPSVAPADPAAAPEGDLDLNRAVDALKQRMISHALRETGSKTRAAEKLGIPRQSLQKMMKRLGLKE
jgi:transcriptional regulator with PAS, ATPase and Fis domain